MTEQKHNEAKATWEAAKNEFEASQAASRRGECTEQNQMDARNKYQKAMRTFEKADATFQHNKTMEWARTATPGPSRGFRQD